MKSSKAETATKKSPRNRKPSSVENVDWAAIDTQLRSRGSSLEELCEELGQPPRKTSDAFKLGRQLAKSVDRASDGSIRIDQGVDALVDLLDGMGLNPSQGLILCALVGVIHEDGHGSFDDVVANARDLAHRERAAAQAERKPKLRAVKGGKK